MTTARINYVFAKPDCIKLQLASREGQRAWWSLTRHMVRSAIEDACGAKVRPWHGLHAEDRVGLLDIVGWRWHDPPSAEDGVGILDTMGPPPWRMKWFRPITVPPLTLSIPGCSASRRSCLCGCVDDGTRNRYRYHAIPTNPMAIEGSVM